MAKKLYQEILFANGDKCQIYRATLEDYSKAIEKYNEQKKHVSEDGYLDVQPFIIERVCLFNNIKKDLNFILKLNGDVYFKILPILNSLMELED